MTTPEERTKISRDPDQKDASKKIEASPDLDAEIVRDLEVDEQADAVRGGCTNGSMPG